MFWLLLMALLQGKGDLTHFENRWGWSGTGEAFVPQLVMYATPPHFHDNPAKIDRDIDVFLAGHGFNGFHVFLSCRWFDLEEEDCRRAPGRNPPLDPRTFEALELLIRKTHQAGGMVHLWAWGDEQRGQTLSSRRDWGGLEGRVARKVEREIARRLGPVPGWSMGYGFDLDEWVEPRAIHGWRDRLQNILPRFHFLGGRPAGPNRGAGHEPFRPWNRGLDYASYEHHRPSYEVYVAALEANPGKPVLSEDRFRVLPDSDSKHYSLQQVRRGLWHSTLAGGVGNIWGYLLEGGSHELGSAPFPNRHEIRTHFEFVRGRFLKGMKRCSPPDTDPAARPLCLGSDHRGLLYKESTRRVELPPGLVDGAAPAVAVDAKRAYREIELDLAASDAHWEAPYESDWALAVGRFDRPREIETDRLEAPSELRVLSGGSRRVDLAWTLPAGETSASLERAEARGRAPGDFRSVRRLAAGENRYSDESIDPPATYWYRVHLVRDGVSAYSPHLRVFVGAEDLVLSELTPWNLEAGYLGPGDRYYVDREYELRSVPPSLEGAAWIRTANDDKLAASDRFLSFEVTRPVTVFVGFDARARSLPRWLRDWESLPDRIVVRGDVMASFDLYRRVFPAGAVHLGGNSAGGADFGAGGRSHYVVAISPAP